MIFDKKLLETCIRDNVRHIENCKYYHVPNSSSVNDSTYIDISIIDTHGYFYNYSICLDRNKTIAISTSYSSVHLADFSEMDRALKKYQTLLNKQQDSEIYDFTLEQLDKEIRPGQLSIYDEDCEDVF